MKVSYLNTHQLETLVVLARFRTLKPNKSSRCYATLQAIAKVAKVSPTTVRRIIKRIVDRNESSNSSSSGARTRIDNVKSKKDKYFGTLT